MRAASLVVVAGLSAVLCLTTTPAYAGPGGDPICAFQPDGCLREHSYTVRSGDWLWKISRRHLTEHGLAAHDNRLVKRHADEIYARNRTAIGPSPHRLRAGMRLLLPTLDKQ